MHNNIHSNRELWNGWTRLHVNSDFYNVAGFKAGKPTLDSTVLKEVGEVAGKSLLHLQCHFGLDTLSWARQGAIVTGVDFSGEAIALARSLSGELGIPAKFLCAELSELPQILHDPFDIVFTSYGVLPWIPDLDNWAKLVAHYVKPDGIFYIAEIHPIKRILAPRLKDCKGNPIEISYFHRPEPTRVEEQGSYANWNVDFWHPAYYWSHGLGEIVTALVRAGLLLEFLHEFPSVEYPNRPEFFSIRARGLEQRP